MSFPPGTEMFQFPGFASNPYFIQGLIPSSDQSYCGLRLAPEPTIRKVEGGFPHSEIPGSKLVRSSPRLIAAYHVLHRLSAPRHPPNALKALDRSRDRCPLTGSRWKRMTVTTRSQKDQWQIRFRTHHRMLAEHDRRGWQISLPQRPHSLFTMSLMSSPTLRSAEPDGPCCCVTAANSFSR